ncbi:ATP-binding protein [Salinispirillum sp. LH 10-3-1]|uniref:histidine kinase n=1 Tax=Salinispirillum sp. LH 10-3-1 TaxID=2952525 RepID=A0AB38YCX3_9GAMM
MLRLGTWFNGALLAGLLALPFQALAYDQYGRWLEMSPSAIDSPSGYFDAVKDRPTGTGVRLTGGTFWYGTQLSLAQAEHLVIDFRNTFVLASFTHYVYDQDGQLIAQLHGGVTDPERGEYFLRHGQSLRLASGDYRILTRIDSPYFIAIPEPYLQTDAQYRQSIRVPMAITLVGLGIFLALGFYYIVMGLWRRSLGDTLYAGFIIGNLVFNSASHLVLRDLFGLTGFYLTSVPILFSNVAYVGFVMILLGISQKRSPRFFYLGIAAISLMMLFWPVAMLQPQWSLELARYGVGIFALYGLSCGIAQALQRNKVAYFYLVANVAFVIPAFFTISLRNINIADTFLIEHLGLISVGLEVLLLAQVMSYQVGLVYREREQRIREAQQAVSLARESVLAKERFLANMSHELRTPLNAIHGTVELLKSQPLELRFRRQLDTIHQSSKFLLYLINDILDLAKMSAGKMKLAKAPFDLDRMLQNVCDLYRSNNELKEVDLLIEVAPEVPSVVVGDESRLKQVLANLLSNAYKFTDEGCISIQVRFDAADHLYFAVVDSGVGIAPEHQDVIFDAFTQVDDSSVRRHGGAGLGLQICTRLVHMMGGELHVTSTPGEGSTFHFVLPMSTERPLAPGIQKSMAILYAPHWQRMAELARQDLISMDAHIVLMEELDDAELDSANVEHWLVFSRHYDSDILARLRATNGKVLWFLPESVVYDLPVMPGVEFEAAPYGRYHLRRWIGEPLNASEVLPITESLHNAHIVAVDDNPINLRVVTALLEKLGATVHGFDNASRAIDYIRQHSVDLILMDIQMPDLDGLQASERLRAQGFSQPIIAFTANVSMRDREACTASGMNDVLVKPVRMEQLRKTVQKWLVR